MVFVFGIGVRLASPEGVAKYANPVEHRPAGHVAARRGALNERDRAAGHLAGKYHVADVGLDTNMFERFSVSRRGQVVWRGGASFGAHWQRPPVLFSLLGSVP